MKGTSKKSRETQTQHLLAKDFFRLLQAPNHLADLADEIKANRDQSQSENEILRNLVLEQEKKLEVFQFQHGGIEDSLKKLAMLTDDYYRDKIVLPVCEHLIELFDLCNQLSVGDLAVMAKMEHFKGKLLELLERYGVETINVAIGPPFDPSVCRPVQFEPAKTPVENRAVVHVVKAGFFFVECGKIIRPAEVAVKRMENKIKED